MTLEISLAPNEEARLREKAAAAGKDVQTFAREAVMEKVDRPTLAELLSPIHEGVRHTAISDDEIDTMIGRARDEAWQERQKNLRP